ncbi:ciliary microtubule inner protein 2B isoform X1 [Hydra vulgaris]|uniref:ciliary microtubule inner protein 2B isoform X1 n=1 Tax=Hydra vulgaris TaxID=6087 RepID=UPI0001926AE5|nr:protein FAM166B [Hydra vulgaris]
MALGNDGETLFVKEKLLNPNRLSIVLGYCGHKPLLKFSFGHTYGFHTSQLSEKDEGKNHSKISVYSKKKNFENLPEEISCLQTKQFVPGYTGYIPQHMLKYGKTFKRTSEEAMYEFRWREILKKNAEKHLMETVKNYEKLEIKNLYPKTRHSRYKTGNFVVKDGGDKGIKSCFKAPISGYQGYVPKCEKHMLGCSYTQWVKNAYEDLNIAKNSSSLLRKNNQGSTTFNKSSTDPLQSSDESLLGSVLLKDAGMIPHYTGHVPQQRFTFGSTYSDSTRKVLMS